MVDIHILEISSHRTVSNFMRWFDAKNKHALSRRYRQIINKRLLIYEGTCM